MLVEHEVEGGVVGEHVALQQLHELDLSQVPLAMEAGQRVEGVAESVDLLDELHESPAEYARPGVAARLHSADDDLRCLAYRRLPRLVAVEALLLLLLRLLLVRWRRWRRIVERYVGVPEMVVAIALVGVLPALLLRRLVLLVVVLPSLVCLLAAVAGLALLGLRVPGPARTACVAAPPAEAFLWPAR